MKFLVLTHDIDAAVRWLESQEIDNLYIITETEIAKLNPTKYSKGFLDINYSNAMIEEIRIKSLSYKAARPLAIVLDMKHQTALDLINHDINILYYDGSLSKRLAYNPTYKPNHVVKDPNIKILDLLKNYQQDTVG
jgi:hypothetical protein